MNDDLSALASGATSFFKSTDIPRPSCAINVNFSNLRGSLGNGMGQMVRLSGIIGTPAGLTAVLGTVNGVLAGVEGKLTEMVEDILPDISLRDQLEKLSKETGLDAGLGKIGEIAGDFADATGLEGFVNLNLMDLSKSAFSLGTTFDPCNSSIPNLFKSADGAISSKPAVAPNLGSEERAVDNNKKQKITDNVQKARRRRSNLSVNTLINLGTNPRSFINSQIGSIQGGSFGSISAMGGTLRRSLTGQQFFESRSNMLIRVKKKSKTLRE